MENNLFLPLLGLAGGAALLVMGLMKRGRAQAYRQIPLRPAGSDGGGERRFISGKAHSPASLSAPVSKAACVFYLEKVDRKERHYGRRGGSTRWERVATNACGGFYVNDGAGQALVIPGAGCVDLSKPEATESDDFLLPGSGPGATRRSEVAVLEGETVTVLGTPRTLGELMTYLRQNTELSLPSDLLAELTRLEAEPGAGALRCYFGGGMERLSDQTYEAYVEGTAASGASFIQLGVLGIAVSAAFLIYMLKSSSGSLPEY